MSEKAHLASYMASLLTLLEHQDKSGVHMRSQQLGREFDRCWEQLKDIITKEEEDARTRTNSSSRAQAGTEDERSQSGWIGPDRVSFDESSRNAAVERPRPDGTTNDVRRS